MITTDQIQIFMSLFRGRTDIYAKRWEKNGKGGYSPAYQLNWSEFMAFKAKGGRFSDFPNKTPLMLTMEVIQSHLDGMQTLGIYPLLTDNTSHFIAADFDKANWQKDSIAFLNICKQYAIPAYLERSRSGKGAHVWIFFEEQYTAQRSRSIVLELIRKALNLSEFEKEVSFDRLFPNQDYHAKKGIGNLIALPLHGKSLLEGNTAFLNPETFTIIPDQWGYLKTIQKISKAHLDNLYNNLIKADETVVKETKVSTSKTNSLLIIIGSEIKIKKAWLTPRLVKFLRENLNFFNTEYLIKQKIGISTYQTEKYFKLIHETDEYIHIPRGFLKQMTAFCEERKIKYTINDERSLKATGSFKSKINLYDYQDQSLEEIGDAQSGVIVAPPGSGKTIIGLELIARKSQPTLILVHRKQLLDQWVERIQSFLGIPKAHIGQISGSKKKIGKDITIAMMQSMIKMKDFSNFTNTFGTIIVDECHHIPAKTFRELIIQFNPYYLYGLTATPKRKYNDEKLIYFYIGEVLVTINPQSIASQNQVHALLYIKETPLSVPFDYKTDTFEVFSKVLIFDSTRNQMIMNDILNEVINGRKILVLSERREHVEVLSLYLKTHCEVITVTGEDSLSKRKVKLDQIKQGHFQVLVTTGQLLGEGIDISILDCLFLVYPFSFEGKLTQYIGRIQRSKDNQIVYDYRDIKIDFCEKLFKKRATYYRKHGWLEK